MGELTDNLAALGREEKEKRWEMRGAEERGGEGKGRGWEKEWAFGSSLRRCK